MNYSKLNIFLFFCLLFILGCKSNDKFHRENVSRKNDTINNIDNYNYIINDDIINENIKYKNKNYQKEKIERFEYSRNDNIININTTENNIPRNNVIYVKSFYGDIYYVVLDTMTVGEINKVNVTISDSISKDVLINEIETFDEENLTGEIVRISPTMSCELIDPSGGLFKIIPITNKIQIIEKNSYTKWEWNIIPLKKGNHKLVMSVDIIFENNKKNIEVYEDVIYVYSNETFIEKVVVFFNKNWQWLLSTLLIPLVITYYRKKK